MPEYNIEITDSLPTPLLDNTFLKIVIGRVLIEERVDVATISVALVNDEEIHRLNRQFLGHDFPTDVISFPLHDRIEMQTPIDDVSAESIVKIEGELIVSTETALREAAANGWSLDAELILYVVHGLLHLCGYDDLTDETRPAMRSRERELLSLWGLCPTGLEA